MIEYHDDPILPGRFTGAKLALKPMHVWAVRVRLQVAELHRDIALFGIALDSKLRGCDVVALRVSDILSAGAVKRRGIVLQQKRGARSTSKSLSKADLHVAPADRSEHLAQDIVKLSCGLTPTLKIIGRRARRPSGGQHHNWRASVVDNDIMRSQPFGLGHMCTTTGAEGASRLRFA